jgi:hypothetical protein
MEKEVNKSYFTDEGIEKLIERLLKSGYSEDHLELLRQVYADYNKNKE